jgi:hypothetical protein
MRCYTSHLDAVGIRELGLLCLQNGRSELEGIRIPLSSDDAVLPRMRLQSHYWQE